MDYKKSYYILEMGVLGGAGITFIGLWLGNKWDTSIIGNVIALTGLAIMLTGIGQAFLFYKCPDCGKRFNIRDRQPRFCPKCGFKLE